MIITSFLCFKLKKQDMIDFSRIFAETYKKKHAKPKIHEHRTYYGSPLYLPTNICCLLFDICYLLPHPPPPHICTPSSFRISWGVYDYDLDT